jgi:hypothetical protein
MTTTVCDVLCYLSKIINDNPARRNPLVPDQRTHDYRVAYEDEDGNRCVIGQYLHEVGLLTPEIKHDYRSILTLFHRGVLNQDDFTEGARMFLHLVQNAADNVQHGTGQFQPNEWKELDLESLLDESLYRWPATMESEWEMS